VEVSVSQFALCTLTLQTKVMALGTPVAGLGGLRTGKDRTERDGTQTKYDQTQVMALGPAGNTRR